MTVTRRKAFAYITLERLTACVQLSSDPAAGIQVPAGTMREDEAPEEAVMREAMEETDYFQPQN